jgi:hypothetical protein
MKNWASELWPWMLVVWLELERWRTPSWVAKYWQMSILLASISFILCLCGRLRNFRERRFFFFWDQGRLDIF